MVAARHTAEENSRIELVLPAKQSFSFHFSLDHQDLVAVPALLNAVKLTSSLTKSKTLLLNNFEHNRNVFHPKR